MFKTKKKTKYTVFIEYKFHNDFFHPQISTNYKNYYFFDFGEEILAFIKSRNRMLSR